MKSLFAAALIFAAVAQADDFTLANGVKYPGAKLLRDEADGLVIETDSGIVKLKFADLPVEVQKQYGWVSPEEKARQLEIAHAAAVAAETKRQVAELLANPAPVGVPSPVRVVHSAPAGGDLVIYHSSMGLRIRQLPPGVSYMQSVGGNFHK